MSSPDRQSELLDCWCFIDQCYGRGDGESTHFMERSDGWVPTWLPRPVEVEVKKVLVRFGNRGLWREGMALKQPERQQRAQRFILEHPGITNDASIPLIPLIAPQPDPVDTTDWDVLKKRRLAEQAEWDALEAQKQRIAGATRAFDFEE